MQELIDYIAFMIYKTWWIILPLKFYNWLMKV
jgi:hypothetical protein